MSPEVVELIVFLVMFIVPVLALIFLIYNIHALYRIPWVKFANEHGLSHEERQHRGVLVHGEYQGRRIKAGFNVYENSKGLRQAEYFYEIALSEVFPYSVQVRARQRFGGSSPGATVSGNKKLDRKVIVDGVHDPALKQWLGRSETQQVLLAIHKLSPLIELRGGMLTYRRPVGHIDGPRGVGGFKRFYGLAMQLERTLHHGVPVSA